jgi:hypothetical protein
MYIKLVLCKRRDHGTLVIATAPAFGSIRPGYEVMLNHEEGVKPFRCDVLSTVDCEIDSEAYNFILASHTMTSRDLYTVTQTVHYFNVGETNLPD